jgi:hypothetical protein
MANIEKKAAIAASTATSTVTLFTHNETAQLRIDELRAWREQIPRFAVPETADARQKLSQAASVSPAFIELTNVGVANHTALGRTDGAPPAEIRDLVAYSDAYVPLADELEALAQFIRFSTTAARHLAGTEALTTYALAQRLSRQKRYAHLKPHVADMRRALGKQRKAKPEETPKTVTEEAPEEASE